jgi:hypothetical protein
LSPEAHLELGYLELGAAVHFHSDRIDLANAVGSNLATRQ